MILVLLANARDRNTEQAESEERKSTCESSCGHQKFILSFTVYMRLAADDVTGIYKVAAAAARDM